MPTKVLTPLQHRWFHDHAPAEVIGPACCWCSETGEFARQLTELRVEVQRLREELERMRGRVDVQGAR